MAPPPAEGGVGLFRLGQGRSRMGRSRSLLVIGVIAVLILAACSSSSKSSSSGGSTPTTGSAAPPSQAIPNQKFADNNHGTPVTGGTLTMLGVGAGASM